MPVAPDFENEDQWYGWVESELHGIRSNIVQLHANVQHATENSENFMQAYRSRIDNAVEDYLRAISGQFIESEIKMEKLEQDLKQKFSGTLQEMETKVRMEVQNMFSAQSLENGFLWQNLVNACNQNFAATLQAHMEKLQPQMHAHVENRISQVEAVAQGKLVGSTESLKAWFTREMLSFDRGINDRLGRVESGQAELRARISSACGTQRDFQVHMQEKMRILEGNLAMCMQGLHLVDHKVNSGESSQILAEVRSNLSKIQCESLEHARREGELKAKVESLEKKGEGHANAPPPG